jgi:uncharacterized protein YbjT (DUF2867 family)
MTTANDYQNILLVGASGDLGEHVLSALLADSSFNVTALSRIHSVSSFPSNVKCLKADYSDKNALAQALAMQDAEMGKSSEVKNDLT